MGGTSIRFGAVIMTIIVLWFVPGCGSSTWEDARQADTYEAYLAYIEDNPEGEYIEEAKKRADVRYWNVVKDDTTAGPFQKYLDEFPDGEFRSQAQAKLNRWSSKGKATKGRVTGSNVIIRSDHTTKSASAGVVAREGTIVQILDQYSTGSSSEAILKRDITVAGNGSQIEVPAGKAIRVLTDRRDSVRASFTAPGYGTVEAVISKKDIEAMSGQKWYKILTRDGITGWIYGKFIEEL